MSIEMVSFGEFLNRIDRDIEDRQIVSMYVDFIERPVVRPRQFYINEARLRLLPTIKEPYAREFLQEILDKYNKPILS